MMLIPKNNNFSLLDDIFDEDFFNVPKTRNELMKTDIKEHKNSYEILTDIPGYEKENIKISVENGYLTISAKNNVERENSENSGKIVRKERYYGECQRSFYVGDEIKEEDIKASYNNGTLKISIPKKDPVQKEQHKRYIEIE